MLSMPRKFESRGRSSFSGTQVVRLVPAIRAADVGTREDQIFLDGAEDDTADKPPPRTTTFFHL
jgi:hypothetical protein